MVSRVKASGKRPPTGLLLDLAEPGADRGTPVPQARS
jgi:hypothetical protein